MQKLFAQKSISVMFLMVIFMLIFSCQKNRDTGGAHQGESNSSLPDAPNLSDELGVSALNQVQGVVMDGDAPLVNATVKCGFGAESVQTDPNGFFLLTACESFERYGFITIESPGYFSGYRQYFPPPSGHVVVHINMLPHDEVVNFEASAGATIEADWGTVQFAPGAFAINGTLYTGTVEAFMQYVAPSRPDLFEVIPGGLSGLDEEGVKVLETFGMLGVELFSDDGEVLEVILPAQTSLLIDDEQLALAPDEIDLWSLDPQTGMWTIEGQATRMDDTYQMELPHFSWWNIDVPSSFVWLEGTVDREEVPIGDALVTIYSEFIGCASTLTNSSGEFAGMVPRDQALTAEVSVCQETGSAIVIGELDFGPLQNSANISFSLLDDENHFIKGQIVGCEGDPIQYGYMMVDGVFRTFDNQGNFAFYPCFDEIELVAYEVIPLQGGLASDTLFLDFTDPNQPEDLGEVIVCNEIVSVSDSVVTDGENEYETVIIGTNEWFAENLRTNTYANGEPIIGYTNLETWSNLQEGQQLYYDFSEENLESYGRLYNSYAIEDPRGVCPTGWHVSTAAEWAELISITELFNMPAATVLKSSAMDDPAWNGQNQLGFSATPGGRMSSEGDMNLLGSFAYYWAASSSTQAGIGCRILSTSMGVVGEGNFTDNMGYSVRCVRD